MEPVFGHLNQGEGFRRWTAHGLENVRTQWALVGTAYNLKELVMALAEEAHLAHSHSRNRPFANALVLHDGLVLACADLRN